ncbi:MULTISPECIES: Rqc2 family fibronectin-binding protein [Cyanophyceae]|uniref:Rqc2 homolog RqcH n=1 Tax=Leptolyngbya subtilissima DQ-A4 TaxID=2933933 RepID=A0ABV0K6I9_9CYAN|nr:NFACT RNA binding domain-containing protein [Nodosilinea sp. FACHB-141]MBD2114499.1 NFACT family protein [Nodosilinea sp. FACHB-141]
MQPVDFTTLMALCHSLETDWVPARCETVVQIDTTTLALALRTLDRRGWLTISWHPQAARLHLGDAPPKGQDTFTFSQQLKHQISQLALVAIAPVAPWERAIDLQFGPRPGDPPQWHLYVEIMGKYSNVILANAQNQIVTAAHQVSDQQSRVRPIQTGDAYVLPPAIMNTLPSRQESQNAWQEQVTLVPTTLKKMLMQSYGGLSSSLVRSLLSAARLAPDQAAESLTQSDWDRLFEAWQRWLVCLEKGEFYPGWAEGGYTVLDWEGVAPVADVHQLLDKYYGREIALQQFDRLKNQIQQRLKGVLDKLRLKANTFEQRLDQSAQADQYRQQADLLMTYSHQWQPGLTQLTVEDFDTGEPVTLAIDPDKTAIQQAQRLYKQHQKLKRAKDAVAPLLAEVQAELAYLEQVEAALTQIPTYDEPADLEALIDIRNELIQQDYMASPDYRPTDRKANDEGFRRLQTPDGLPVLVGRNNRQNDLLISTVATDYDLWFHTQEIPGSHVLLRLGAGQVPSDRDLAYVADLAAYFSRARHADQVPVIYTQPRHVYKPKGARPGMVIYKQETVIWGQPRRVEQQQAKPLEPVEA